MFPKGTRQLAIESAVAWVGERLNGEDGLGAIFPAMANSVMMYDALGYPPDHPQRAIARRSIEKLLVVHADEAYCQPCVSPIWDTGLACHALLETGDDEALRRVAKGLQWLRAASRFSTCRATGSRAGRMCGRAAGRSSMPTRIIPMSTTPRWWRWRWTARSGSIRGSIIAGDRAGAGMDPRSAEQERRLGRVRCRQRISLSQPHPVRRPRRLARSADRGRHRALRVDAGAARRDAAELARGCGRGGLSQAHAARRRAAGTAAGA